MSGPTMSTHEHDTATVADRSDNANVLIRPPIALALAIASGLAASWLYPLPFVPAAIPAGWVGAAVFAAGFALAVWAVATMLRAGTRFETHQPTTRIVAAGPYRFTRNPIYSGMFLALIGLAIGFDSLWLLAALVLFYFVIRYRSRRPRGGLSGAQIRQRLSRLQDARAPLALRLNPPRLHGMAGRRMTGPLHERRHVDAARLEGVRAARVEGAAGRRRDRVGDLALDRPARRARSWRGRAARRSACACRDGAGARTARAAGASSTMRPRYMTPMRVAMWRTTARLWLMNR